MKGIWRGIVVLLPVQAGIAAAAAAVEWSYSCGACRAGGLSLGLPGFAFYAGLSLAALFAGPTPLLFCALFFGFGVHVMLVAQLFSSGLVCGLCMGAAGVSLVLTVLSVIHERVNLVRLAVTLPWSVLLVIGWTGAPRNPAGPAIEASPSDSVRILVFDEPDCPYCEELRDRVIPEIVREFGSRVRVIHRPAGELPAIRRTPTVIVAPAGRDESSRVFEGLPSVEMLRRAIRDAEEES